MNRIQAKYSEKDESFIIYPSDRNLLEVLGSNLHHDGCRTEHVSSASFAVKPNETGIIAIVIRTRGRHDNTRAFFLAVDWKSEGGRVPLNIKRPATLPADRLAWFDRYVEGSVSFPYIEYAISVRIGEEIFTTRPDIPDKRHVANGDLICKYLARQAEAAEVIAAAEEAQQKLSAIEQLDLANKKLTRTEDALQKLQNEYDQTVDSLRTASNVSNSLRVLLIDLAPKLRVMFNYPKYTLHGWLFRRFFLEQFFSKEDRKKIRADLKDFEI